MDSEVRASEQCPPLCRQLNTAGFSFFGQLFITGSPEASHYVVERFCLGGVDPTTQGPSQVGDHVGDGAFANRHRVGRVCGWVCVACGGVWGAPALKNAR